MGLTCDESGLLDRLSPPVMKRERRLSTYQSFHGLSSFLRGGPGIAASQRRGGFVTA